jgi:hypothetical protein
VLLKAGINPATTIFISGFAGLGLTVKLLRHLGQ